MENLPIFDLNHGLSPFEKCKFFFLTYRETDFPGPIGKKKEWISFQFFTKTIDYPC